jgi:hypothetical protein
MRRTIFLLFILLLVGCKGNKAASVGQTDISKEALATTWHLMSVENALKIFSSNAAAVTPRRGFESIRFEPNGIFSRTIPGPTDRPETTQGTWKWISENQLNLTINGTNQVLRVSKLTATRLELFTQD